MSCVRLFWWRTCLVGRIGLSGVEGSRVRLPVSVGVSCTCLRRPGGDGPDLSSVSFSRFSTRVPTPGFPMVGPRLDIGGVMDYREKVVDWVPSSSLTLGGPPTVDLHFLLPSGGYVLCPGRTEKPRPESGGVVYGPSWSRVTCTVYGRGNSRRDYPWVVQYDYPTYL